MEVVVVDDEDGNMGCDNHCNGEEEQHWLAGTGTSHCQQPCSLNEVMDTDCGAVERSVEEYANEVPRVMEDPSAGALSDAEAKAHESMEAIPILFERGSKRKIAGIDVKDNGDDGYRLSQCGERKRIRHHEPLPTFDACLEQVRHWMDMAKMVHVERMRTLLKDRSLDTWKKVERELCLPWQ